MVIFVFVRYLVRQHCCDWLLIISLNFPEKFVIVFNIVLEGRKGLIFLFRPQCILPFVPFVQWRVVNRWESLDLHRIISKLTLFLFKVLVHCLLFLLFLLFLFLSTNWFNFLCSERVSFSCCAWATCVLLRLFHAYGFLPIKEGLWLLSFDTHPGDTSTSTFILLFLIFLIIEVFIFLAAIVTIRQLIGIAWDKIFEIYCRMPLLDSNYIVFGWFCGLYGSWSNFKVCSHFIHSCSWCRLFCLLDGTSNFTPVAIRILGYFVHELLRNHFRNKLLWLHHLRKRHLMQFGGRLAIDAQLIFILF